MSFLKSSAARWFEALLEDAKKRVSRRTRGLRLEYIASGIARLGDKIFPRLMFAVNLASRAINKLQLTMIESMIVTSLLFGILALILALLLTIGV